MPKLKTDKKKKSKKQTSTSTPLLIHYENPQQLSQLKTLITQTLPQTVQLLFHQPTTTDETTTEEEEEETSKIVAENDENVENDEKSQKSLFFKRKKRKKAPTPKPYGTFEHMVNEVHLLNMFHKRYEQILRCDQFMIHLTQFLRRFRRFQPTLGESGVQNVISQLVNQFEFSTDRILSHNYEKLEKLTDKNLKKSSKSSKSSKSLKSSKNKQEKQKAANREQQSIHHSVHSVLLHFLHMAQMIEQLRTDVREISRYLFNELSTFHKTTFVRTGICLACMARIHCLLREYSYRLNQPFNALVFVLELLPKLKHVIRYLNGKQSIVYKYDNDKGGATDKDKDNDNDGEKEETGTHGMDGFNIYRDQLAQYLDWEAEQTRDYARRLEQYLRTHTVEEEN